VNALLKHDGYKPTNPNDMYALIGGFSANLLCFHGEPNAQGYTFLTERVREIGKSNPQVP
jgi:aminopeptidase N